MLNGYPVLVEAQVIVAVQVKLIFHIAGYIILYIWYGIFMLHRAPIHTYISCFCFQSGIYDRGRGGKAPQLCGSWGRIATCGASCAAIFFTFSFRNGVGDAAVERLKKRVMANAEIRVHRACSHSDISERLLVLVTVTDFHSFRINF